MGQRSPSEIPHPGVLQAATGVLWGAIAALHLGFLAHHSLWNNEFITLKVIELPWLELIAERLEQNHMPGYFLMLKAWTAAAGKSEAALHLPSAVMSLAGCAFVWLAARRLFGSGWALFALAIAGLNQALLELSHDARMYSWLYLASAATLWAALRAFECGDRRALAALVAAGVFGLAGHLLYALVSAALIGYTLATWRLEPARRGRVLAAALLPLTLMIPLVVWWMQVQTKVGGATEWDSFKFSNGYRMVLFATLGDLRKYGGRAWLKFGQATMLATLLLTLVPAAWRAWRRPLATVDGRWLLPLRHGALLWTWVMVTLLAIVGADVASRNQLSGAWRYYIATAPAACLLITAAVRTAGGSATRLTGGLWAVGLLAAALVCTVHYLRGPGPGLREAIEILKAEMREDDGLVVSQQKNRSYGFIYYGLMTHIPPEKPDGVDTPEGVLRWIAPFCQGKERLWVVHYNENEAEDPILKMIRAYPDWFEPLRPLQQWEDNSLGLYRPSEPLRRLGAAALPPLQPPAGGEP